MIRPATFFDVPEILRLADVYMREEVSPAGHHSTVWDAGMMADNLMTSIRRAEDLVVVSIQDGEVTGYLWAATHCLGPWSPVIVASDYLFYVATAHRGGTSALRLANAYKLWATELGCAEVRLSVASGINQGRVGKLYERLGFTPFACIYNHNP